MKRLLAIAATALLLLIAPACHAFHPERCNKAILVIDGQEYVSCQSGLRPIGPKP